MTQCKCGSFAINHNSHGRDGSDIDLCDVCYWRKRAVAIAQPEQTVAPKTCFMCHGKGWHYMAHAYPPGMAAPETKVKCTQCIAQPAQQEQPTPVAWQWLDTGTFRKTLPKTAVVADWNPLFKNLAPLQPESIK